MSDNACPYCGKPVGKLVCESDEPQSAMYAVCVHCKARGPEVVGDFTSVLAAFCYPAHLTAEQVMIKLETAYILRQQVMALYPHLGRELTAAIEAAKGE